ncbi:integrin beta pat-3 [Trichonephila clavipes]|nr:integrin beta pat-3 [Trichonephila clavipes]
MLSSRPGAIYQQDNARPHTARLSQQCLQGYDVLPWPARLSPGTLVNPPISKQNNNSSPFLGVTCNNCHSKETCGQCIAESALCAWCTQENFSVNGAPRCDFLSTLKETCNASDIVAPEGSLKLIKDMSLSDKGAKEGEAIQIKPQEIRIRLRPNTVQKLTVEFRQAVDYPIDLYYLMDLSNSMADDKEKLAKLGNQLAEEMKTITTNFKLGFGSFVDKTVTPYVNSHPDKLKEPCPKCAAPYGFRNNMRLSSKTREFASKVENAPVSGNLDAPEGGFDALMQVIVCKDEVEKLAYQLNEEAERTERPIRRLSKVMYGRTCADMQVDVMGECLSSIKHVVGTTSGCFYPRSNHWEKLEEGRSVTSVAAEFGIAHSIVSRLWRQFQTTGTAILGFSSGRPRGTPSADDRYIVLQARRNRRQTAGKIARHTTLATGRAISRFTVARRLHGGGLFARRLVRCVPLTPAHRRRRSLWCRNTGIGETMNGDEYSLQMKAD